MILGLALLGLVTPVLIALTLNHYDARRSAADEARREADRLRQEDNQRQRAEAEAEQRRQQDADAQARRRLIEGGGLRLWIEQLQINETKETNERVGRQKPLRARSERLNGVADRCIGALPQARPAWVATAAVVFGLVWIIAVCTNLFLDVAVFLGIGHGLGLAIPLAILLVLTFSVVGLALTDCMGFTHALPGIDNLSQRVRIALPIGIALAVVVCFSQLPQIVQHRSADIAAQVYKRQEDLSILRSANAPTQLLTQAQSNLQEAQDRLSAAKKVDSALAIAAAGTEMATSWAAIWLVLLIVAQVAKRQAREAEREADELQRISDGAEDRIRQAVLARAIALGLTEDELARALRVRPPHVAGLMPGTPPDLDSPVAPETAGETSDRESDDDDLGPEQDEDLGGGGVRGGPGHHDGPGNGGGQAAASDESKDDLANGPAPMDLFGSAI